MIILWIVWHGDGFGHNWIVKITGDKEHADHLGKERGHSVEEVEVEDIGKAIEAALTKGCW